jgi:hypothetical protein
LQHTTSLLVLALLAICSQAAPAPQFRERKPAPINFAGQWVLHWGGSVYALTLHPDGSMRCGDGGIWVGSWTGKGRTLYVSEVREGGRRWFRWTVKLDGYMEGLTGGELKGVPVRMRRKEGG